MNEENLNEELLKQIKSLIPYVIAVGLVVGGYYGVKNYLAGRQTAATAAVTNSVTTDDAETAVANFGDSPAGGVLNLQLAKRYFDDGRYEEALAVYEKLSEQSPDGFADVPVVGKAQCLEALGKYAEARQAYESYLAGAPADYLKMTAKLGAIRATALAGEKDAALKQLAELKETVKTDPAAFGRVTTLEEAINRGVK